jgi:uncharacterized repeat protein (TIGR03943 family)
MNLQSKIGLKKLKNLSPWLDILALLAWGTLLMKYLLTAEIKLLIHPNYFALVFITSVVLLLLGLAKVWQMLTRKLTDNIESQQFASVEHITLFPLGLGSGLLIGTAILGLVISPTALNSETAIQRGISESLPITRLQPENFRPSVKSEQRSLIEWVRTLNAYPEPEAYVGQKAKYTGFVIHLPNLPDDYLLVSRFVITCCAVDAYPVGIPVKINGSRQEYPSDTWVEVEGEMMATILPTKSNNLQETRRGERQVVLMATSLKKIPTPKDPYEY